MDETEWHQYYRYKWILKIIFFLIPNTRTESLKKRSLDRDENILF